MGGCYMRSIKDVERKISVNNMVIGKWYRVFTTYNEYIFKYNGMVGAHRTYIGRDYSYCVNDGKYGHSSCVSVCGVSVVRELYTISRDEVLKWFSVDKL